MYATRRCAWRRGTYVQNHRITRLRAHCWGTLALAQSLPATQPNLLQIIREEVKVGHADDHVKTESGWPAAFEKAKSPYYSLALVSLTGSNEAWFIVPYDSHKAMADDMKRSSDDPNLTAELARLSRADAEHLTGLRTIQAMARKELSHGAFPDTAKQRFWELTLFRVRPGHEEEFTAAAKAYGSATDRVAPSTSYRVYEVIAGMPGPAYLLFSSTTSFGDFDKSMSEGEITMKGATAEERAALQKFSLEALISAETQRFRLDPEMSYVPKEVRAQDPAFWMPKKPAVKPPSQP
jgi:hypothetical protein